MWGIVACVLFFLATTYTVPAPKPPCSPQVARRQDDGYPPSGEPTARPVEAHRGGKRGIGDWLATLFVWGVAVTWMYAFVKRFFQ